MFVNALKALKDEYDQIILIYYVKIIKIIENELEYYFNLRKSEKLLT